MDHPLAAGCNRAQQADQIVAETFIGHNVGFPAAIAYDFIIFGDMHPEHAFNCYTLILHFDSLLST